VHGNKDHQVTFDENIEVIEIDNWKEENKA